MLASLCQRLKTWMGSSDALSYAARLSEFPLGPDDVAIDCGANVGEVTEHLAAGGATVYAFEPNPHAFARLKERFARRSNVHCIDRAVLDRVEVVQLFLHQQAEEDPVKWSTGSSVLGFKSNVDQARSVQVEAVDLAAFVLELDREVRLLKLDVEGVECCILNRLIDSGAIARIGTILVETHEKKIPEIREEMAALRTRIAREDLSKIRLDWV
ncbi:MAG TPA: FkbM family methyltransferase [Chthoniobacteraceae bacterium]|jgi:FkbM family methyltransferase|nr:FkbM family methyltransferase [Chthoniobacteraceae bacterium]